MWGGPPRLPSAAKALPNSSATGAYVCLARQISPGDRAISPRLSMGRFTWIPAPRIPKQKVVGSSPIARSNHFHRRHRQRWIVQCRIAKQGLATLVDDRGQPWTLVHVSRIVRAHHAQASRSVLEERGDAMVLPAGTGRALHRRALDASDVRSSAKMS